MSETRNKIGVLVMSYGTPESMDGIEAYYTHIRRGHKPTPEQLQALTARYEAIVGGFFPLRANTDKQVKALEEALNRKSWSGEYEFVCYQGLKHASPYIEDGVRRMAEDGIKRAVGVVLAPHYSVMSVGAYIQRAESLARELGVKMEFVRSYHLHPSLIEAFAERVQTAMRQFAEADGERVRVIFSAHSLPQKVLEMNDPYQDQMLETSRAIAARTGIADWQFAWQSAGQTAVPWLGPDIMDVLASIGKEEGIKQALICPIGFVSDHLEILYDIDIECMRLADRLGMKLVRTQSLGTDPRYIEALCDAVKERLDRLEQPKQAANGTKKADAHG